MALVKVYDLDGQEHEKESVDARECVQILGWTHEPGKEPESDPANDQFSEMTVAELKGHLDSKNIPYGNPIKKADLLALCRG